MKIALDVHGTIDVWPKLFSLLTRTLSLLCVEIHITTGIPDSLDLRKQLKKWGIYYDKIFSITDYHVSIGTHIEWDEKGHPHIDDRIWDSTKADYCRKNKIFLAIDDSPIYSEYFTTPYLHFKIK